MSDVNPDDFELSRRRFLAMGGTIAAAGALGPLLDPLEALAAKSRWPSGRLGAKDAKRVKDSQFMPVGQFRKWNEQLDKLGPANQKGLRATGSDDTEGYIDELRNDLEKAGVTGLTFDPVPLQRWTTGRWSLDMVSGTGSTPVQTASYIPYSGKTGASGVTAPLALVPVGTTPAAGSLSGKIAVFDVPSTTVPLSFFTSLAYEGASYDPNTELVPTTAYKRPYLSNESIIKLLEAFAAAGAVGAVGVLDYPLEGGAEGSYFPYDGVIRSVPGVYVDRSTGATLKERAQSGATAKLSLPAQIKKVKSRNLIGFIPGRSKELVTLHCHTDGSNALEDNGPGAIVAISQYLARLPKSSLPRTVMVLLTTGHFHGGAGSIAFVEDRKDLLQRTNAAITIEHLGLKEWDEVQPGVMGPTGRHEPGAIFAPGSSALVQASLAALQRGKASPAGVLKPLNPNASGDPNEAAWPGEGQYLFSMGGIGDANYITGPTYLLNWGIKTADKVSHGRVRAEAIAFTEMILALGRTPREQLRNFDLS